MLKKNKTKSPPKKTSLLQVYDNEKKLRSLASSGASELNTLLAGIIGELEHGLESKDSKSLENAVRSAIGDLERAENTVRNIRYITDLVRVDGKVSDLSQLLIDSVEVVE